jgi:hypothetical protein
MLGSGVLLVILCAFIYRNGSQPEAQKVEAALTFQKIIDSSSLNINYAYAPSIIKIDNTYHLFFCSYGSPTVWDYIRYTKSTDGKTWSAPTILLKPTQDLTKRNNFAACDPSVVFYQGYYYLYYSNAYQTSPSEFLVQTVIDVARSTKIDGPYQIYTGRGTWESTPKDPKHIILPLVKHSISPSGYGAGQQTVIARNDKLYMWYLDDSLDLTRKVYMLESADPVSWSPSSSHVIQMNDEPHSVEVKFDPITSKFLMFRILRAHESQSHLGYSRSVDGIHWDPFTLISSEIEFPDFAHNPGTSSDQYGTLLAGTSLIAFGTPYDLSKTDTWGKWDLYGTFVSLNTSSPSPTPGSCYIQGYKVLPNLEPAEPPSSQPVSIDGANSITANPYAFINVSAGSHTISVPSLPGYTIGYTLCTNSITCHTNSPTLGTSVTIQCPSSGFVDLWWHYMPQVTITPTLSIMPTQVQKAGDANNDTKVDGIDFVLWLNHYSQVTTNGYRDGDFNTDRKVDGIDFVVWLSNYGT